MSAEELEGGLRMMRRILYSLIALCCGWSQFSFGAAKPMAVRGIMDLQGHSLDSVLELRGDWAFYWQNQFTPEQLESHSEDPSFINVPNSWYQDRRHKFSMFGSGTYRLHILLNESQQHQQLAVSWPEIWTASRIFIDGQLVASYGIASPAADQHQGGTGVGMFVFTPRQTSFDIVVQVSNFDIFLAGISKPMSIGTTLAVVQHKNWAFAMDIFVIGALFVMGIYHLCLFALRTEDASTLFFGFFCLAVLSYTLATGRTIPLMELWTNTTFAVRLRYLNLGWVLATLMFIWFAYHLFKENYSRRVAWVGTWIAIPFGIFQLVTPPWLFVNAGLGFQFGALLIAAYTCRVAWQARRIEGNGSLIFLGGVLVLLLCTINDMLTTPGVINTPMSGGAGVFSFIFFQSYLIARRFSFAFIKIKVSEGEIRHLSEDLKSERDTVLTLNQNLEKIVEEKTRDIRSIMEHLPLGIFAITGADCIIAKEHSRLLGQILDVDKVDGMKATDLLFADSQLSTDEKSQAISCIQASMGELDVNFEANISSLPIELQRKTRNGQLRTYDLTWDPIINEDNLIDKILVTIRDVTELRGLQEKAKDQQEELEFIGEILNVATPRFLRFISTCNQLMDENERLLKSKGLAHKDVELLKMLFINMHTMKGAARSLYFKKMTHIFHDVEQYYAHLQKDLHQEWNIDKMCEDLKEARRIVTIYEKVAREKLGRDSEQSMLVEFRLQEIQHYYRNLTHMRQHPGLPQDLKKPLIEMSGSFFRRIFTPARTVFDDISLCLPTLAKDLHKTEPEVQLIDHNALISPQGEELIRNAFVHILRNSMDHGIEYDEERRRKGKPSTPVISIELKRDRDQIKILYSDDGRGLNMGRLREIGLEQNLLGINDLEDMDKIAALIFDSGMSTASRVTEISGRGVGMCAVEKYLKDYGGSIRIILHPERSATDHHYPFSFEMALPLELFAEALPVEMTQAA